MAMPMESPISFSNVGRIRWWRRGVFASQTAYVALALLVLLVVMHFASPYFFTEGNMQNVAKNFSFIAIATLGITFVIITGGIDLSVGSMMCFSAMITSMVMSGLSTPGMPGASLFVHLAADGKTVVANVPGLILVVSVLAGLARRADRRARQRLLHRRARAVAVRHHARHALDRARPRLRRLQRPGQFPGGPDADYFYALTSGDVFGVPAPFIYLVILAAGDGGRAASHRRSAATSSRSAATRRRPN